MTSTKRSFLSGGMWDPRDSNGLTVMLLISLATVMAITFVLSTPAQVDFGNRFGMYLNLGSVVVPIALLLPFVFEGGIVGLTIADLRSAAMGQATKAIRRSMALLLIASSVMNIRHVVVMDLDAGVFGFDTALGASIKGLLPFIQLLLVNALIASMIRKPVESEEEARAAAEARIAEIRQSRLDSEREEEARALQALTEAEAAEERRLFDLEKDSEAASTPGTEARRRFKKVVAAEYQRNKGNVRGTARNLGITSTRVSQALADEKVAFEDEPVLEIDLSR